VLKNIITLSSHLNRASPEPVEGSVKPLKTRILGDLGFFNTLAVGCVGRKDAVASHDRNLTYLSNTSANAPPTLTLVR